MINWSEVWTFNSYEDALEAMALLVEAGYLEKHSTKDVWWPAGTYYLKHGEYAKPEYRLRKRHGMNEWYVYARYFFYHGTLHAPQNGPVTLATACYHGWIC